MQKKIPFHKIDRVVRFKKSEIELWVESGRADAVLQNDTDCLFADSKGGCKQ